MGDGIESAVCFAELSPHEIMERMLQWCGLCWALNSLPEIQGCRIEAHFILGMSYQVIAEDESAVRATVKRGL